MSFDDICHAADGVMGTPLPYSVRGDNVITILLLACGALLAVLLVRANPLQPSKGGGFQESPLPLGGWGEVLFFLLIDCLLLAIVAYVYAIEKMECSFVIQTQSLVMLLFFVLFLVYFGLKAALYSLVNSVFFNSKKTLQWNSSLFSLMAMEAVLLLPLVLLLVYFDLSVEKAQYVFLFILFLNKLLAFYKGWSIFFHQKGRSLQIFLYFCALEIVPLLALGGVWLEIVNILKVNF